MNAIKKNIGLTNGWILCPSKSFPGKFYYFNVLNGEAAWSLNEADKKTLIKETTVHKVADKCHEYPEPTTMPDDNSITEFNIGAHIKKLDSSTSPQLPTFGQVSFPTYVNKVEPVISNVLWAPVQLPIFYPESKRPMSDKVTQTSDIQRELFIQSCDLPLCERFKNYERPSLCFDNRNKIVKGTKFGTSTPKKVFETQIGECIPNSKLLSNQIGSERIPCSKLLFTQTGSESVPNLNPLFKQTRLEIVPNSKLFTNQIGLETIPTSNPLLKQTRSELIPNSKLIKEPVLKFERQLQPKSPEMTNTAEPTLTLGYKVEITKSGIEPKVDETLDNLDRSDLRFFLLAKRRKSVDISDVERKRSKSSEEHVTPKKKVTFDLDSETDEDTIMINKMTINDFIPQTRPTDIPKTQHIKDKSPINTCVSIPKALPTPQVTKEHGVPVRKNVWYIVADTDVLLLDYDFVDQLVLSDPKCRLIIPHMVRADIEGLCIGDCQGQQRVINARKITRKLVNHPPHYTVEPEANVKDIFVTSDNILNCCMQAVNQNYYVVLITNDPHLQSKAKSLNINSYKLSEIKYGVNIKPDMTSEHNKIKINPQNKDKDPKNPFSSNISNLKSFNDYREPLDKVKKQLFLNCDKNIRNNPLDCDKLINITKTKCLINSDSASESDSTTSDINKEVSNLNLKEQNILKTQNVNEYPFLTENVTGFINFEKRILNSNAVPNSKQEILTEKSVLKSNENPNFQKDSLKKNTSNTEKLFCSIPISNMKLQFQNLSTKPMEESGKHNVSFEQFGANCSKLNASRNRIQKMLNTINCNTTIKNENKDQKAHDNTGVFKIPQPLSYKNRTKNTSAPVENPTSTDKIGTRSLKTLDSIDENLKRFCVKSKTMSEKISSRIDEWICTFIQILEDVLNGLLRKNTMCMKNTVAPLTIHDTINYVKMLYNFNKNVRDAINSLSILLDRCVCDKGKPKTTVNPDDFMKMFGYGVLLVLSLQNILPLSEELKDAESQLSALLANIESKCQELDPDLLRTPSGSRVSEGREELRPNFVKDRSYVIDYLKKHFKDWTSHDKELDYMNHNNNTQNQSDFKVVRTFGKTLNLLKIDKDKTISLTQNSMENNTANNIEDGPKIVRLVENNQLLKPNQNVNEENLKKDGPKLMKLLNNEQNNLPKDKIEIEKLQQEKDAQKFVKSTENTNKNQGIIQELNFTTHYNTFADTTEIDGPKMIRNIKLIDEYEKKINKGPLDLDLLDYSEIYEPSVAENPEFDIISMKNLEENKSNYLNINDNFGITNTKCLLEDFDEDNFESKIPDTTNIQNTTTPISNNTKIDKNINKINDISAESVTFTEVSKFPSPNKNVGGDNFESTAKIVRDDSTNDSGFENDSTYAHSVVKIFLYELSSAFKVIYKFITKFIDEIRTKELSESRKSVVHNQASQSLEHMVAIIQRLKNIIDREAADDTVLKTLLLNAGVEATSDKRITRYRCHKGHLIRNDAFITNIIEGKIEARRIRGRPRRNYMDLLQEKIKVETYEEVKETALQRDRWKLLHRQVPGT